jgi:hypothetical protein
MAGLGRVLARLGRVLAASWPCLGRVLAASWPRLGRVLAASWPRLGRFRKTGPCLNLSWPRFKTRALLFTLLH